MDTYRLPWRRAVLITALVCLLAVTAVTGDHNEKTKRQIFREQVLPHSGGKIPESAFRSDRLALNKLQKLGVAVPDGVSLDTRPHSVVRVAHDPETEYSLVRIVQEDEGRYVPPEGRSYPVHYPNTVQSTYIIRPPIGSYYIRPHIHRAIPGPPLRLAGASIHAAAGAKSPQYDVSGPAYENSETPQGVGYNTASYQGATYGTPHYQGNHFGTVNYHGATYGTPNYQGYGIPQVPPAYPGGLAQYIRDALIHHLPRVDPAEDTQGDIPAPTPSPDHAHYVAHSGLDGLGSTPGNVYSSLLGAGYSPSVGLLKVNAPYAHRPYSFLNFPSSPGLAQASLLDPAGDLALRLRRRSDQEGTLGAASQVVSTTTLAQQSSRCEGRDTGKVYADPRSNCKEQYICLPDGRAAAYVCPEGSVFDHRAGKCATRSLRTRKRRVKLDSNCDPVL